MKNREVVELLSEKDWNNNGDFFSKEGRGYCIDMLSYPKIEIFNRITTVTMVEFEELEDLIALL